MYVNKATKCFSCDHDEDNVWYESQSNDKRWKNKLSRIKDQDEELIFKIKLTLSFFVLAQLIAGNWTWRTTTLKASSIFLPSKSMHSCVHETEQSLEKPEFRSDSYLANKKCYIARGSTNESNNSCPGHETIKMYQINNFVVSIQRKAWKHDGISSVSMWAEWWAVSFMLHIRLLCQNHALAGRCVCVCVQFVFLFCFDGNS